MYLQAHVTHCEGIVKGGCCSFSMLGTFAAVPVSQLQPLAASPVPSCGSPEE